MNGMVEKLSTLGPEMCLLIGGCICLVTGLDRLGAVRRATVWVAALSLVCAGFLTVDFEAHDHGVFRVGGMAPYIKLIVCGVGLILLMIAAGVPMQLRQTVQAENAKDFEPGDILRGEFFAFFLFSLTGVMLCASADDLVWLFLALELTSLPTYVMVATAREKTMAQESAVKYFFLGAMSAAVFLYGFALIYGATGFTSFDMIRQTAAMQIETHGAITPMLLIGMVLAVIGVCFKIAAVPMHFYAADVYEGASTPVTAFLAFTPKVAGFVALILLLGLVAWFPVDGEFVQLPPVLVALLWIIAVLTMSVGNVLGLLQKSVKRTLAYSSIAHSGYILMGVLVGPGLVGTHGAVGDGIAAVLFYLPAYGLATIASFAVIGCMRRNGEEADSFDDLSGLARRHPWLAWIMMLSVFSLLGIPPFVGFLGKVYLFGSAIQAQYIWLVVIAVVNSAVSAGYYLHILAACFFGDPDKDVQRYPAPGRRLGAGIAAFGCIALGFLGGWIVNATHDANIPGVDKSAAPITLDDSDDQVSATKP